MITWDDAQTNCQDLSSDSTTASLTLFKRFMNTGYKLCLSELGRAATEKTDTSLVTVASTQYYNLPMACLFLKSVAITVGGIKYPVIECEDQEEWDYLLQNAQSGDIPEKYFVRMNYGVGASEVGIYPKPSSASNTFTLVFEVMDKDLAVDKYITGTLTMTNGDETVAMATGSFTAAMVDRYIKGGDGF